MLALAPALFPCLAAFRWGCWCCIWFACFVCCGHMLSVVGSCWGCCLCFPNSFIAFVHGMLEACVSVLRLRFLGWRCRSRNGLVRLFLQGKPWHLLYPDIIFIDCLSIAVWEFHIFHQVFASCCLQCSVPIAFRSCNSHIAIYYCHKFAGCNFWTLHLYFFTLLTLF